uniref:Uncharacterized protein n=1 Tax=Anguilla anguilla TaxID=7936 RepID=A0A0E9TIJ2_ANGAN
MAVLMEDSTSPELSVTTFTNGTRPSARRAK